MSELVIEANKYYRTRDGRKAFVAGITPFGGCRPDCKACGFIESGSYNVLAWGIDGSFMQGCEKDLDLIAPWTEPRTWTVYMYAFDGTGVFPSVRELAGYKLLAKVQVTEGEGL